jgi:hypothetical protein
MLIELVRSIITLTVQCKWVRVLATRLQEGIIDRYRLNPDNWLDFSQILYAKGFRSREPFIANNTVAFGVSGGYTGTREDSIAQNSALR